MSGQKKKQITNVRRDSSCMSPAITQRIVRIISSAISRMVVSHVRAQDRVATLLPCHVAKIIVARTSFSALNYLALANPAAIRNVLTPRSSIVNTSWELGPTCAWISCPKEHRVRIPHGATRASYVISGEKPRPWFASQTRITATTVPSDYPRNRTLLDLTGPSGITSICRGRTYLS